jgi:uncharacterized membrane protein
MIRLGYALLLGAVGAGIIHIAILLMLPSFSERDAWSRLAEAGGLYTAVRVGDGTGSPAILISPDPFFKVVACRFDLAEGALHVRAPGGVPYWSVSVYNRQGENIYSLNDRSSADGALDMVIATPVQLIEVRKNLPPEFETAVFVEADITEGMVLVRGFVPDESWNSSISTYLDRASCQPWQIGDDPALIDPPQSLAPGLNDAKGRT